ncbi:MAG TPA: maleylpyruvate isomerase family mycothiol-dependent enzyme [Nocardioidaceae bacterium]|nr:maleylpyruvate isomerase family mycothiol-dependent enzyme [Nocardioidaceae bacterium]
METSTRTIAIPNLVEMVVASTRFLGALSDLTDDDIRAPSLLPGWTRGHVVTHVARNADALGNLLHWAESGQEHYMYDSPEHRDADIEAGAGRSAHDLRVDAAASAGRFMQAINELDVRHEDNLVARDPGAATFPAREVASMRLVEIQVHHADLDIGFGHEDWDTAFCELLLSRVVADRADGPAMVLRATDTGNVWKLGQGQGPTIEGPACDLAWWVIGRGDGSGLTSDSDVLPQLSKWR